MSIVRRRLARLSVKPLPISEGIVAPTVKLRVSVSPALAQIFVDDARLASNPFEGTFPRDGNTHLLRVEAHGFVSRSEVVSFDTDRVVEIEMSAEVVRPPPVSTSLVRQSSPSERLRQQDLFTNPYHTAP